MKLSLGQFNYGKDWVHLNDYKLPHTRYENPFKIPLKDNSVDLIYSCHFLQKYSYDDSVDILRELKRILKPGEVMRVSVPDFFLISDKYLKSKCKLGEVNKLLMNEAKQVLDFVQIQKILVQAGFYAIKRYNQENFPMDDLSSYDINGEIISLNVEAYG